MKAVGVAVALGVGAAIIAFPDEISSYMIVPMTISPKTSEYQNLMPLYKKHTPGRLPPYPGDIDAVQSYLDDHEKCYRNEMVTLEKFQRHPPHIQSQMRDIDMKQYNAPFYSDYPDVQESVVRVVTLLHQETQERLMQEIEQQKALAKQPLKEG